MNREIGMAVEYAGVDQPYCRHHQGKFATDRARGVIAIELLGLFELERGVHEHEEAKAGAFGPKRLEFGRVQIKIVGFRRYHHTGKTELVLAPGELPQCVGSAERIGMRSPDEPAGIIAFSLLRGLITQARLVEIGAHPGRAGEQGGIDTRLVHHTDVLVEIEQHPMQNEAGRSVLVVGDELAPAEILGHQFARREVMLEIDDHRMRPLRICDRVPGRSGTGAHAQIL